jgi:hypothetical protein
MSGAVNNTVLATRSHRLTSLQFGAVVFEVMELMVVRGLKVPDLRKKVVMAFRYLCHQFKQIVWYDDNWAYDDRDRVALATLGRLVEQCLMLFKIVNTYFEDILKWQISASKQPREVKLQARSVYNFIEFALHINQVYRSEGLSVSHLQSAAKRALEIGTPEVENVVKRLVSALTVNKALWMQKQPGITTIVVGDPEDFPAPITRYLAHWYDNAMSLGSQSKVNRPLFRKTHDAHHSPQVPGSATAEPIEFNNVLDWYC